MATDWDSIKKPGSGWEYDQAGYTYDQALDPNTGAIIYYDSAGEATQWTAINKP